MDIKEIREKYPQYSDLSDEQVAKGFHQKFYSDMDYDEFASKIGVSTDFDFKATEMIKNIPGSAVNVAKDIFNAVSNPVETSRALGSVLRGVDELARERPNNSVRDDVNEMMGREPSSEPHPWEATPEDVEARKATAQHYKERYGSIDNFQRTLQNDPVGAGMDIATVAAPVTSVMPKTSQIANAVRTATNPAHAANVVRKFPNKGIPENVPASIYERAAKFGTKVDEVERGELINTALNEGVSLTHKGFNKLNNRVAEVGQKIGDKIDELTKAGKEIPAKKLFDDINPLIDDLGGVTNLEGAKNAKAIRKIANAYAKQLRDAGTTTLTPRQVQNFKTNLYDTINWNRSQLKSKPAKEAAQKTFAKTAKEKLQDLDPELGEMNAEFGPLRNLQTNLQPVMGRVSNRDPISLSTLLKMGVAETALPGSGAGMATGAALGYAGMPAAQSRIAIALSKARNKPTLEPGAVPPELWPILYQSEQVMSNQ